jgi:hypothetical protein
LRTDLHLYPRNLLFIEALGTIPVFGSMHTQTPTREVASMIASPATTCRVGRVSMAPSLEA